METPTGEVTQTDSLLLYGEKAQFKHIHISRSTIATVEAKEEVVVVDSPF